MVEDDKIKALEQNIKVSVILTLIKKTKADVSQVIKKVPTRKKQVLEQVEKL